jgi:hypothetical protein
VQLSIVRCVLLENVESPRTTRWQKLPRRDRPDSKVIVDFLPDPLRTVTVQCLEYTCLAYLDDKGIWRSPFSSAPIPSRVLGWFET